MKSLYERAKRMFNKDNSRMKYPQTNLKEIPDPKKVAVKPVKKMMERDNKRMRYPKWDKRGMGFLIGIMVLIISIILFIATLPAISNTIDTPRQCNYFNCNGFIDDDADGTTTSCAAGNYSNVPTSNEEELGCIILDLVIPFLILTVLVVAITLLQKGKLGVEPEPMYGGYGGGY